MKTILRFLLIVLTVGAASAADFRRVGGKVYDAEKSDKWESFPQKDRYKIYQMDVEQVVKGGLVAACEAKNSTPYYIFVKNHPDQATAVSGRPLARFRAMLVGRTNYYSDTVPLYDCGTPYVPTPAEAAAAKEKLAAIAAVAKEQELARKTAAAARQAANDAALLKSHQELAAQGDAYGLLCMGERHLSGDGVEKSEPLARKYLEQASAKGSVAAARALEQLGANTPSR
jgi:hypothetical protein